MTARLFPVPALYEPGNRDYVAVFVRNLSQKNTSLYHIPCEKLHIAWSWTKGLIFHNSTIKIAQLKKLI